MEVQVKVSLDATRESLSRRLLFDEIVSFRKALRRPLNKGLAPSTRRFPSGNSSVCEVPVPFFNTLLTLRSKNAPSLNSFTMRTVTARQDSLKFNRDLKSTRRLSANTRFHNRQLEMWNQRLFFPSLRRADEFCVIATSRRSRSPALAIPWAMPVRFESASICELSGVTL